MGPPATRRPELVPRRIALPGGKTLVVRAATLDDVAGLEALYAGLSDEDRYRRFFSFYRPPRAFFERIATSADRGGCGLVATVAGPGGADRIVGEAGYVLLPDGDGELAITVAADWRGWLGPYLLDALVSAAAAAGVPNLEADVLVTNGPMLALLRARGCATMDHPDWTEVRVLIGTSGRTAVWPGPPGRPRVLVEVPGGRWHLEGEAKEAGLQVLTCGGPDPTHPRCPALTGRPCPLAEGADAIVVSHPPDREEWHALRRAHRHLHPAVPVCVELAPAWEDDAGAAGDAPAAGPAGRAVMAFLQRLAGMPAPGSGEQ